MAAIKRLKDQTGSQTEKTALHKKAIVANVLYLLLSCFLITKNFEIGVWNTIIAGGGLITLYILRNFDIEEVHTGAIIVFALSAIIFVDPKYLDYFWPDIILHYLGGFFAAWYVFALTKNLFVNTDHSKWLLFFWSISLAMLIGVVWEFAEGVAFLISHSASMRIEAFDILADLLMDLLGAITITSVLIIKQKVSKK